MTVEELVNLITKIAGVLSATRAGELLVAAWGNTCSRLFYLICSVIFHGIWQHTHTSIGLDAMPRTLLLNLSFLAKGACINLCHPVGLPQFQLQFQLLLQFQLATVGLLDALESPTWPPFVLLSYAARVTMPIYLGAAFRKLISPSQRSFCLAQLTYYRQYSFLPLSVSLCVPLIARALPKDTLFADLKFSNSHSPAHLHIICSIVLPSLD